VRIAFSTRELRDIAAAWVALSVAFAIFLDRRLTRALLASPSVEFDAVLSLFAEVFGLSFLTVGVGFLLHELGHKVTAIHFGKRAEFRADYSMLLLAIVAALAGFLFAAPGAVYHVGRSTERQNGIIALAGPVVNLGLAALFAPLWLFAGGFAGNIGSLGVTINLLLAGFNMIPFGPLDGNTVLSWSKPVYAAVAVPSVALAVWALLNVGLF